MEATEKENFFSFLSPYKNPCVYTKQTTSIYIKTERSGMDIYYVEITVQK